MLSIVAFRPWISHRYGYYRCFVGNDKLEFPKICQEWYVSICISSVKVPIVGRSTTISVDLSCDSYQCSLCLVSSLYFPRTYKHTSYRSRISTGKLERSLQISSLHWSTSLGQPRSTMPAQRSPTTPSIDFDRTFDLLQIEVDFNRVFAKVSIARFGLLSGRPAFGRVGVILWFKFGSIGARLTRTLTLTGWLMRSAAVERVWNLWQNIWAALYQVGAIAARCEY